MRLGTRDQAGQLDKTTVKTADRVPFGEWSGSYVRINSKDSTHLEENDIVGETETQPALKHSASTRLRLRPGEIET